MAWNRQQRRQLGKYGLIEAEVKKDREEVWRQAEETAQRLAFSGMILALAEKFDFPVDRLHDLAVETMKNVNGALCPSQLVDRCREKTGFDVDEPLELFEVNDFEALE